MPSHRQSQSLTLRQVTDVEDALLQSGGTAGLIAAIWGVAAAIKQHKEKNNGGSTYTRITILENRVGELQEELTQANDKLVKCHRDLCEFREEFRIFLTRSETREEMRREMLK